ncbi:MAG: hypothetical protein EXS37_12990 [Opitutus sp.]|nr:hypothetical protein [Opitutus sp.]
MKNTSCASVHPLLLCALVTIGFGGSIAIGTVLMRHQISTTANVNRSLKSDWERIERLVDGKKTVVETELAPDKLRELNSSMRLGLVPMNEVSVVHVTDNTTARLAARAARDDSTDRAGARAAPIAFRIAQH